MKNPVFQKIRNYTLLIGEGAFDLGVNLMMMIMVERSLGVAGLGIFSYLLSLFVLAGFLSEFGISSHLEREVAMTPDKKKRGKVTEDAARAILVTSLVCTAVFFIFAVSGMTLTRVDERAAAYIIMGITIPIRNFNRLRVAFLQGNREYDTAATFKSMKRLYLLGAVFVLLKWNFLPSYLMLGYLFSEIGLMVKARKKVRLPGFSSLFKGTRALRPTLEQSVGFFLTDEALDVILYMDFLILGFFVTSQDLGLYAEASILARIFLLIPISIKPVFLGQYCALAAQNRLPAAASPLKTATAFLFFLHSVLGLYILLFFSGILETLFKIHHVSMVPFYIFAEIFPGLLFFSAVASQEPLYEAAGQVGVLQKRIITVAGINLVLNLFFIPVAGFFGAAFATTASMFAYFMFFGAHLNPVFRIDKMKYVFAGAAVYLTFMLFQALDPGIVLTLAAVPVLLFMLLMGMDFFNVASDTHLRPMDVFRLARKIRIKMVQPETGGFDDGRQ